MDFTTIKPCELFLKQKIPSYNSFRKCISIIFFQHENQLNMTILL